MIVSQFTELCTVQLRTFSLPQEDPSCPVIVNPHSHPQPQETTSLLSISIKLPFLVISDNGIVLTLLLISCEKPQVQPQRCGN